jgi:hypothetical protein
MPNILLGFVKDANNYLPSSYKSMKSFMLHKIARFAKIRRKAQFSQPFSRDLAISQRGSGRPLDFPKAVFEPPTGPMN